MIFWVILPLIHPVKTCFVQLVYSTAFFHTIRLHACLNLFFQKLPPKTVWGQNVSVIDPDDVIQKRFRMLLSYWSE